MQEYSEQVEQFKQYLVSCIKCLLLNPVNHQKLVDSSVLNNFIVSKDQQSIILLYVAKRVQDIQSSRFDTHQLSNHPYYEVIAITAHEDINISLLPYQTIEYLCQDINSLYLPYVQKNHQQLVGLLENVKSSVQIQSNLDESKMQGRLNRPQDEFNFWKKMREKDGDNKKRADIYLKLYQYENMEERWTNLSNQKLNTLKDLIDITLGTLDQVWESKANYNSQRFKKLVEAFTKSLWTRLSLEIPAIQAPKTLQDQKIPYKRIIKQVKQVFMLWIDMIKQSQQLRWQGNVLKSSYQGKLNFEAYIKRLDEIQEIISLLSELNGIKDKIQNSQSLNGIEKIFENIQIMGMSEHNNKEWEITKRKFQVQIEATEKDISRFLKSRVISIAKLKQKPIKAFKQLLKRSKFLNRKNISKALSQQKQAIYQQIQYQLQQTRHQYESRTGQSIDPIPNKQQIPMIKNFSRTLSEIIWIRQFSDRANKLLYFFTELFNNHPDSTRVINEINQLLRQMKRFQNQVFDNWKSKTLEEIRRNEEYSFDSKSKMMDLDLNAGTVKVNYSDKLVGLIKQIRQLSDLGYRKQIPQSILQTANKANSYYKQALNLKKIAHYYNTLSEQIIESQKGMILQQLMSFENAVKNINIHIRTSKNQPTYITWDNTQFVSAYIQNLTTSINVLQRQNSRLKKIHFKIMDILGQLFDYDLSNQKNKWQELLIQIKRLVDLACDKKDAKQCRRWKTHCDVQLYKVLELQYLKGVQDMQTTSADIDIQIIIKNKNITFKPSFQEIKERYYKQLKQYIEWPIREFKGITGGLQLYRRLPQKNSQHLVEIFSKSQSTFRALVEYLNELNHWGVVSYLSVNQMKGKLKTMKDWEDTIKLLKLKRKDLQRMSDYQKIETFNINNIRFKNQVDQTLQKVIDNLMTALKHSIQDDADTLQIFILQNLKKLEHKPQSLQQIQKIKNEYLNIKAKQKQMQSMQQQVHIKNKWLLLTTGFGHNIDKIGGLWQNFTERIADFDSLLKEQMEHLKSLIQGKTSEIKNQIEKYQAKTSLVMPSKRRDVYDLVQTLIQYKEQENQILQRISNLKNDCLQFQVDVPNLSLKTINWEAWNVLVQYFNSMKEYEQLAIGTTKTQSAKLFEWQDTYTKWVEQLRARQRTSQISFILKQIELFKNIFPVIKLLYGGVLQKQHWRTLYSILKINADIQNIKLGTFLNIANLVWEKNSEIKDLISKAQGEIILKQAIQQLTIWSETATFQITQYQNNSRKTPLIKEWSELSTKVSDNLALVYSLKESKYAQKFMSKIIQFQTKMGNLDLYLLKLKDIQRRWIYLQPIFIRGSLPEQAKRFQLLDTNFRNIMFRIKDNNKVFNLLTIEGLASTLESIQEEQERCQKALNDFLQDKRNKFPRFYFLGDQDLLEILGQSQNPVIIQQHLKKLFAAIHSVQISNNHITAICSVQQEVVYLSKQILITQAVENWLLQLEKGMFQVLDSLFKQYIKSSNSLALNEYPSQILCLMQEVRFSQQLQKAISNRQLPKLHAQIKLELQKLTSLLPSLSGVATLKLKAIILDIIRRQSLVSEMINSNDPISLTSYLYTKNFKIYATVGNPQIKMFNYTYQYTFQYQGNIPKLVHTPLTDKCYITLALAMSLGYGGNPYGPAGTGKTETVKSLGMYFGRMVLVFNCDEGLDYKSIARIFLGLVRCGAWGCFDEFNRLKQDQLSAISQSIQIIQNALKAREKSLQLLGKSVQINHNSGIFVTLNPAGKGYGGRSKLPDNLKQLFRPIAMSVPDNELIAEVLLYAEGFKQAKSLSKKIICLFTLSKQLLSPQQHYDWGLRALKTILVVSGRLIFEQRKRTGKQIQSKNQAELLIKAIRINTLSKLTFPDMRKFKLLLNDIFPSIKSQDISYPELQSTIPLVLEQMGLCNNPNQISKILQFYEATQQRMGVVLVGPSGCGKTTIINVLKKCYDKLNIGLKTYLINPKSMPKTQLLGLMNNDTRQFTEGVMTIYSRQLVKNGGNNWIILDGDIDPEWIESLNSVLDDNHLLTLPTGQRINFSKNTCFIFETDSLLYASPATVSRMGMIYLNNQDISVSNLIEKQLRGAQNNQFLKQQISKIEIEKLMGIVQQNEIIKSSLVGKTMIILSMLKQVKDKKSFIQKVFKGLTANCSSDIKNRILQMIFQKMDQRNTLESNNFNFYAIKQEFKTYYLNKEEFILSELINEPIAMATPMFQNNLSILNPWIRDGTPFVVVGSEGCGKSLLIKEAFKQLQKNVRVNITTIHCNSQTKPIQIINKLYQICLKGNRGGGRILKPKDCSRQVLYLKDINLPKPDKYDTIELVAFLQQLISHKGFYDPDSLQFIALDEKIQIVCSMLPSTDIGRFELSSRFTSIIRILNVRSPDSNDLIAIYTEYFKSLLREKKLDESFSEKLAKFLVEIYNNIRQKFSVDEQRHYKFNPKNLYQIFSQMLMYDVPDIKSFVQAFNNQILRGYRDRLVGYQTKSKFQTILVNLSKQHFQVSINTSNLFTFVGTKILKISKQDYSSIIKQSLVQYQREYKQFNLIMLDQTINKINVIQKKLGCGGNMLLCGKSGVGRRTAVLLASLIQKIEVRNIPNIRGYTVRQFRKDMKSLIQEICNENKKIVLLIEDHHLSRSQFQEMINSLLSSSEIPGLFSNEQVDRLPCAEDIRRQIYGISLYQGFCRRVKTNLKIIISLDYSTPKFHTICSSNPAFYNCTIVWFDDLLSSDLQDLSSNIICEELKGHSKQISQFSSTIHSSIVKTYNTSQRQFYNLIETLNKIYLQKMSQKQDQSSHLQSGLDKLKQAQALVDKLSNQAIIKQKLLVEKRKEADQSLKGIASAVQQATERKQETQQLSGSLYEQEKKIQVKKASVQDQLADVKPLIEQAKKSVQQISKSDLTELMSLRSPPEAVEHVMTAVMRMFGQYQSGWNTMKTFFKGGVLDQVMNYDPKNITPQIRRDVEKVIQKHANSFEDATIKRASKVAYPLSSWVKAILKFSKVLQSIRPLQSQLNSLLKALQTSKSRVIQCQERLAVLDEKVKGLKESYGKKVSETQLLKKQLEQSQNTLQRARSLLSKLEDEKVRWEKDFSQISRQARELPFNSLLASAFTCYLTDKDETERAKLVHQWASHLNITNFSYLKFMTVQSTLLKWRSQGLPYDSLSLQNSVGVLNSMKPPLIIDSNSQAIDWFKKLNPKLQILSQQDPKFTNTLQLSVRFGKSLLIQQLDRVQQILVPVIRKNTYQQLSRNVIKIGQQQVDYNPSFQLFLCTRNSSIDLPSNIRGIITVVNYTITKSGLESKLLSIIINHQKPELEHKKIQLLENEQVLKMNLQQLQKKLLTQLAESTGNILQNTSLLQSLNKTKVQSTNIANTLKDSQLLNLNLDKQRNLYKPLAETGAEIYLLLGDLFKINNMYKFSLSYFVSIFIKCLNVSQSTLNQEQKLNICMENLYRIVYNNIASSLFKNDRLAFGLHLLKRVKPSLVSNQEWKFFIQSVPPVLQTKVNLPKWAPFKQTQIFNTFYVHLPEIANSINFNDQSFEAWFNSDASKLPPQCNRLTSFQKVLIVQIFKPQKLQSSLNSFILQGLGISTLAGNNDALKSIVEQLKSQTPLLFIVSPGYDPSKQLYEIAIQKVGKNNYKQLSMGGEQDQQAVKIMKEAAQKGQWICFKNLHLVIPWLPQLQKEFKALAKHQNFKLFFTTESHPYFPNILLQTCLKICYQAPPGIKKNLQRIYQLWEVPNNPNKCALMFLLAYFHSLIQERRTYIPQGWSKYYQFSYSDLKVAEAIIDNILKEYEQSHSYNITTLHGLFQQAIYGGRIDNVFDLKVLKSYLHKYFNHALFQGNVELVPGFAVPKNQREVMNFINKLPQIDNPSIYGLPSNADKAVQRAMTQNAIANLKSIKNLENQNLKFQKQKWQTLLSPTISTWKKIYKHIKDLNFAPIKQSQVFSQDPIEGFVYIQIFQSLQLAELINSNIQSIQKVIFQNGLMTTPIQKQCINILQNTLPKQWQALSTKEGIPSECFKVFGKKVSQLKKWLQKLTSSSLLNQGLNLSELFNPEVFINSCKQKFSRKLKIPIDMLQLTSTFNSSQIKNDEVIKLKGLLMQGSVVNKNYNIEQQPKNQGQFFQLPTLYISFSQEKNKSQTTKTAQFSVFTSQSRQKILLTARLPYQGKLEDRILAGTAILLPQL